MAPKKKGVSILGATGSIGTSAIDVIRNNKEHFFVTALAAKSSWEVLLPLVIEFEPSIVVLTDVAAASALESNLPQSQKCRVMSGNKALDLAATADNTDITLCACSGAIGLKSTVAAIKAGIDIALANKEVLVAGGKYVTELVKKHKVKLLPVDSEHSAIFQAISGRSEDVSKIILTASGGPFYGKSCEDLKRVTLKDALKHPNWSMGHKITIDSATLMNKGLEVIEAHWLFSVDYDNIDVVVHQQSIIHSLVEMKDTSVIAQLGLPDMRLPIQYALSWPERFVSKQYPSLDLIKIGTMTFLEPDLKAFPALRLAYESGKAGKSFCTVLNSSNEIAVEAFVSKKISFTAISHVVEEVLNKHIPVDVDSLDVIIETDEWARNCAHDIIDSM